MGFASNRSNLAMSFLITSIIASALFALLVTRPGMRVLTHLCPRFFDRLDWSFMTGLKDGLYEYSSEFGATDEEERTLETQLLLPLMYGSAGFALASAWLMALFGFSTIACLFVSFIASLVPFLFGLTLLVAGVTLRRLHSSFGFTIWSNWDNAGDGSSSNYAFAGASDSSYTITDRVYDFFCERRDALKAFRANPRGLMDACDDLYDAGTARLLRKRH